ncbi:SPOR domain-containing protein [Thiomicrorhabdus sp. Kp2]|uniref:SPOR domain-containing protein n=1 Tax=Thiomicrorhabdus sp. Kp2 TaxID=1123518 RepID=UPI000417EA71|nr:SPOR domain-containing protein [Thiomicrorhabdus sp. Kp2]
MDLISKYRLIGASIWLGLLVLIVPQWYSHPVNFVPEGTTVVEDKSTLPIVEHAYRLPENSDKPLTNGQQSHAQIQQEQVSRNIEQPTPKNVVATTKLQKLINKSDEIDSNEKYKGQWIVRLLAFKEIHEANDLLGQLDTEYDVYIKFYEKTKVYSVRTGPYLSKAKADKDKAKLDKMLHTNGEVVQLP